MTRQQEFRKLVAEAVAVAVAVNEDTTSTYEQLMERYRKALGNLGHFAWRNADSITVASPAPRKPRKK